MHRRLNEIRLTHKPTGISVRVQYDRAKYAAWASEMVRKVLAAKLCSPVVDPIRRTYDLAPYLGIDPHIREQDGTRLATGMDALRSFLDGVRPDLESACTTGIIGTY